MKDKILDKLIKEEVKRQQKTINLIPSENYASSEILEVMGSVLMNKYSEGYPGKRYYPGNKIYDQIELLAQERIRKLFNLGKNWHINVQPYSGSPANLAVYFSLIDFGESIMGMRLDAGGHLTHGHRVNFSGRAYKAIQYGVDLGDGLLNYDEIERLAEQRQPKIIVSGATAYPREIDFKKIGKIARRIGAYHVADISHIAGLVSAGEHPSPFNDCDVVTLTTHKTLRGPRAAIIICREDLADRIDRSVFPGIQGGPHNNQIAAIALMAFQNSQPDFKSYQKQVLKNAQILAETLQDKGIKLVTNGTDNHLMIIDLKSLDLSGKEAEKILEQAGITANRNSVPGDMSPQNPSGIRLGTPAITTRGMKEEEVRQIAGWISDLLLKKSKPVAVKKQVDILCNKFPLEY
ncbi:TPA: serine hydroxymethyltransferase [Patescibacteria group bacterium]|nr:serine hydroxymethyltransferase [Patescibacteria group bacterium]|tara:strand:- start:6302 stop:7519 length:1218 start_codon:yes stop_codon:yes gene_type:complete